MSESLASYGVIVEKCFSNAKASQENYLTFSSCHVIILYISAFVILLFGFAPIKGLFCKV